MISDRGQGRVDKKRCCVSLFILLHILDFRKDQPINRTLMDPFPGALKKVGYGDEDSGGKTIRKGEKWLTLQ